MNTSEAPTAGTDKAFSAESPGYLLSRVGLLLMLGGLIFAAWFGQVTVALLLALLLAAAGLAKLWSRFALSRVTCERRLSQQRAFPGEQVELKVRLVNGKLLPLPWVQVDDEVPLGFAAGAHTEPENRPGFGFLSHSAALLWYTGISWRHQLTCRKRGYYKLGPLTVTSGDIFGFYPRSIKTSLVDHLIVYPRIFPVAQPGIPSVYPLGETRSERQIFEDATRTLGIRDYQPQDSVRRIHWKASARHQKLQSRVYEPTTTLKVGLFLGADTFPHTCPDDEERFELGISVAASLANYLNEQDSPVGLFVNTRQTDSGQPVVIPPGSGVSHLIAVLEALAKTTSLPSAPFEDFMDAERANLPWGTTLVFVLSEPHKPVIERLAALKESGYKLIVVQVGSDSSGLDGVVWHRVSNPADPVMSYQEAK